MNPRKVADTEEEWAWREGGGAMTAGQANHELCERLYLCGCGIPGEVSKMIGEVLEAFDEDGGAVYEKTEAAIPHAASRYFMFYQLDRVGWTEHGSCTPGWLTERGLAFREALREFGAETIGEGSVDYNTGEMVYG